MRCEKWWVGRRNESFLSAILPEIEKCLVTTNEWRPIRGLDAFVLAVLDEDLEVVELSRVRHRGNGELNGS